MSAVPHAYLNPFVPTLTTSLEDTYRDYHIFKCCSTHAFFCILSIISYHLYFLLIGRTLL